MLDSYRAKIGFPLGAESLEYDKDHELIAQYTMDTEKFIYRVYKYDFQGFYFQ